MITFCTIHLLYTGPIIAVKIPIVNRDFCHTVMKSAPVEDKQPAWTSYQQSCFLILKTSLLSSNTWDIVLRTPPPLPTFSAIFLPPYTSLSPYTLPYTPLNPPFSLSPSLHPTIPPPHPALFLPFSLSYSFSPSFTHSIPLLASVEQVQYPPCDVSPTQHSWVPADWLVLVFRCALLRARLLDTQGAAPLCCRHTIIRVGMSRFARSKAQRSTLSQTFNRARLVIIAQSRDLWDRKSVV